LRSIDWSAGPVAPLAPQPLAVSQPGVEAERLVTCEYFQMDRYRLAGSLAAPYVGELSIWLALEGDAVLGSESSGYQRTLHQGETILIPAAAQGCTWQASPRANLLGVRIAG
jgi:mannose-6-phosphate isomerase class I